MILRFVGESFQWAAAPCFEVRFEELGRIQAQWAEQKVGGKEKLSRISCFSLPHSPPGVGRGPFSFQGSPAFSSDGFHLVRKKEFLSFPAAFACPTKLREKGRFGLGWADSDYVWRRRPWEFPRSSRPPREGCSGWADFDCAWRKHLWGCLLLSRLPRAWCLEEGHPFWTCLHEDGSRRIPSLGESFPRQLHLVLECGVFCRSGSGRLQPGNLQRSLSSAFCLSLHP